MSALAVSDDRFAGEGTTLRGETSRSHLYLVPDTVPARAGRPGARGGSVQLTERGLLAVLVVFGLLALTSVAVILASFFAVSDAPVGASPGTRIMADAGH